MAEIRLVAGADDHAHLQVVLFSYAMSLWFDGEKMAEVEHRMYVA